MKTILTLFVCGLLAAVSVRADTTLSVGKVKLIIPGGPCWDDTLIVPTPMTASNTFTLAGVSGTGWITSAASEVADNVRETDHYFYTYTVDVSGMSAPASHCIKLLVHFGPPLGCDYDVLLLTNGMGVNVTAATLASLGDVTLTFGSGGCLSLGKTTTTIGMVSDTPGKYGTVTVIDDYPNGNNGTNETRVNVGAVVPNVPPDWAYLSPVRIPFFVFQGYFGCNAVPQPPGGVVNGFFNFTAQVMDAPSNGLAMSPMVTQSVQVVNGLFTTPLPFDPNTFYGGPSWLSLAVQPASGGPFTPLNPTTPLAPTPQAVYAYSAGVVADLTPGQAVTSLNGLTDAVNLQAGNGIYFGTNGNTLTISAAAGVVSDRNLKTDFGSVGPEDILARVASLPIGSWRYTSELAGVHHVGPMAQDFRAAFGLGNDGKMIYFVDESGVALAAIQGLNQKLNERDAEIKVLQDQLDELKVSVKQLAQPQTK